MGTWAADLATPRLEGLSDTCSSGAWIRSAAARRRSQSAMMRHSRAQAWSARMIAALER
jgi:hypothetical protein